jgi:hypothetical protein
VAELMYLEKNGQGSPIEMLINSSGTTRQDGEIVSPPGCRAPPALALVPAGRPLCLCPAAGQAKPGGAQALSPRAPCYLAPAARLRQ